MVEVEINCTRVADTDPIIALRSIGLIGAREYDPNLGRGNQHRVELSSPEEMAFSHR